jgi:hypothetical protein
MKATALIVVVAEIGIDEPVYKVDVLFGGVDPSVV